MSDISRVKEHIRTTKTGTKTVKGYDRKKRLKKILAGIGVTGLAATGLVLNKNRIKNILNKSKVLDVEDISTKALPASKLPNLKSNVEDVIKSKLKQVSKEPQNSIKLLTGSNPKLLSPAKERLRNTTQEIKNDVITVTGSPETKKERLARLFPSRQEKVNEYVSKRKVDTGKKGYLTKAKKELELADKIEENATTKADLSRADNKRIKANAQISRSTKRLRELEQSSPLTTSLQRTGGKLTRTDNSKIKVRGKRPKKKL